MFTATRPPAGVLAGLALSAVIAAAPAAAQDLRVPVGDLSTPSAAKGFDHRLEAAGRRLCAARYAPLDLDGLAACRDAVRAEALAQLSPAQQRAYAGTHRRSTRLASR